jgi:hypothetical protein
MANTKFQVNLAVDGNHSVSVQSDDPAAVTAGLVWAQDTYTKLVRLSRADGATLPSTPLTPSPLPAAKPLGAASGEVPLCAIHQEAMVWVDKNGGFWSCHRKNADGSWCKYRPGK